MKPSFSPPNGINFGIDVPLCPYLILPPLGTRTFKAPHVRIPTPLPIEQSEILNGFGTLKPNLGSQCTDELLNGIYNIVQKQNSKAMDERFLYLEKSINNAQP